MHRAHLRLVLAVALAAASPAWAEEPRPKTVPAQPEARRSSLDEMFARLAATKDPEEAKGIATRIERRFSQSGSDTADLLMSRAGEALEAKDAALAVELLDRVTRLKPGWAGAWSRRAAAFYLLDDPEDALADLGRALHQEPRDFNAWAALGHIRMASDDRRGALEAYRRALALHPHLEDVRKVVDRIAPEIDGRDL